MTNTELMDKVRHAGYYCKEGRSGQFRCAEIEEPDALSGVAFTLIAERDRWLIELFSARLYEIGAGADILSLVLDLFSGEYVPQGRLPHELPQPLLQKYGIKQVN
jgi:hypothetical protein